MKNISGSIYNFVGRNINYFIGGNIQAPLDSDDYNNLWVYIGQFIDDNIPIIPR